MSQPSEYENEKQKALSIEEAFKREFEPYAPFAVKRTVEPPADKRVDLVITTEAGDQLLVELKSLSTRYFGRKSEWADLKKTIGRLSPEARSHFGQFLMVIELGMKDQIEQWRVVLHALAAGFAAGDATVNPADKACAYCDLMGLCRIER